MDDGTGSRTLGSKDVDVGHNVVPSLALLFFGRLEVDLVHVGLHFCDLSVGNFQTQFLSSTKGRTLELLLDRRNVEP